MRPLVLLLALASPAFALADPAQIEEITATRSGDGWRFSVTLRHADTGWDDYADGWRVEDAGGNVLGTRVLAHPHVTEQPFTRALGGVSLPDGLSEVFIRASTNVDGWADTTQAFAVPRS